MPKVNKRKSIHSRKAKGGNQKGGSTNHLQPMSLQSRAMRASSGLPAPTNNTDGGTGGSSRAANKRRAHDIQRSLRRKTAQNTQLKKAKDDAVKAVAVAKSERVMVQKLTKAEIQQATRKRKAAEDRADSAAVREHITKIQCKQAMSKMSIEHREKTKAKGQHTAVAMEKLRRQHARMIEKVKADTSNYIKRVEARSEATAEKKRTKTTKEALKLKDQKEKAEQKADQRKLRLAEASSKNREVLQQKKKKYEERAQKHSVVVANQIDKLQDQVTKVQAENQSIRAEMEEHQQQAHEEKIVAVRAERLASSREAERRRTRDKKNFELDSATVEELKEKMWQLNGDLKVAKKDAARCKAALESTKHLLNSSLERSKQLDLNLSLNEEELTDALTKLGDAFFIFEKTLPDPRSRVKTWSTTIVQLILELREFC